MPSRTVRIILSGDNRSALRALAEVADASDKMSDKLKAAGSKVKSAGTHLSVLSAGLLGIGYESVKAAASYQSAMTLLRTQTGASAQEIKYLNGQLMRMNGRYGFDPTQMADGLYNLESAGLRGGKAMAALRAAMEGAKIGGDSLQNTTDAVAGAIATGAKDTHNAAQAMQILDTIVGQGKMRLSDLTEAMKSGLLQEVVPMGLGLRDVGTALAAMSRQGVPAETEATRLKLIMDKMAASTGIAAKQAAALGLGHYELANDLRKPNGLIEALTDLQSHLGKLSGDQQTQALANMFGQSRGLGTIRGLLNALPEMRRIQAVVNKAGPQTFASHWAETQRTAAFQWQRMLAQLRTGLTSLGQAVLPVLIPILGRVASALGKVSAWFEHLPKGVRHTIVIVGLAVAALGPLLVVLGSVMEAAAAAAPLFLALTSPIALDVAVIVAAAMAFRHFYDTSAKFRSVVNGVVRAAKDFALQVWSAIKQLFGDIRGEFLGVVQLARGVWELLQGIFTLNSAEIWKGIKDIFGGGIRWLENAFKVMVWPITETFRLLHVNIGKVWDDIWHDVVRLIHHIISAFKSIGAALGFGGHGVTSWLNPFGAASHLAHGIGSLFSHFATGGYVGRNGAAGAGAGSDTVPAMLTPGEYVLRPQVVSALGVQALNNLNQGGQLAAGTPGDIIIPITLKAGERVLAQAVTRYATQMQARR